MTGSEIVANIRAEVVEPNPAFFTDTALLNWMNAAQKSYVRRTRCLQNFATTSTVQGQADYPMPADWLGSEKIFYNNISGGLDSWQPLKPTSLEKLAQEHPNFLSTDATMQAPPQEYYVVNKTLYVYPRPVTNGQNDIFMFYESKPVVMTSLDNDISVDDSLSDGIESYMLMKLYKMDGEDAASAAEKDRFEKEVGQGLKWKKKQMLDGKWKIDIQSWTPFGYGTTSASNQQLNPLNL